MNHWLVKSEPSVYPFSQLVKEGITSWEGVRNYAARLHLNGMKKDDLVLFYHSGEGLSVVGIAKVAKEAYPDQSAGNDDRWVTVDLAPVKPLKKPVPLEAIKAEPKLKDIGLVRIGRLSVMPLKKEEYDLLVKMGG